jgi:hypothetical protein
MEKEETTTLRLAMISRIKKRWSAERVQVKSTTVCDGRRRRRRSSIRQLITAVIARLPQLQVRRAYFTLTEELFTHSITLCVRPNVLFANY